MTRTPALAATALVVVIALVGGSRDAGAQPGFPSLLPNGSVIDGTGCQNCHVSAGGGGARNAFGNAISSAGLRWTQSVCHADSDGDGQTNGFELGDPDCVWTQGATPSRTTAISNPGRSGSMSGNTAPSWLCPDEYRGDGECDCGCGVADSDCGAGQACQFNDCNESHPFTAFSQVDPSDPTRCVDGQGHVAEGEGEGEGSAGEGEGEGAAGEGEGEGGPATPPPGCAGSAGVPALAALAALFAARRRRSR